MVFPLGSGLMVRPVMDEGASYVQLYLPGTSTVREEGGGTGDN